VDAKHTSDSAPDPASWTTLCLETGRGAGEDDLIDALCQIRDTLDAATGRGVLIAGTGAGFVSTVAATGHATRRLVIETCDAITRYPGLVFAASDAAILDSGLEIALACDLRFAAPGVVVGFPGAAHGVLPNGGIQRLAAIGGPSLATRLALLGETPACGSDAALGRIFTVAPDARAAALAALARASHAAPLAIEAIKTSLRASQDLSLAGGLAIEADLACLLQPTADRAEGIDAQLGRRPPAFEGR
jgi:enoyl-CoA hydratase/carnithine racemase